MTSKRGKGSNNSPNRMTGAEPVGPAEPLGSVLGSVVALARAGSLRWMRRAACRAFPQLPWTADGYEVHRVHKQAMRAVCAACPVRTACHTYAVTQGVSGGFWAGRFYTHWDILSHATRDATADATSDAMDNSGADAAGAAGAVVRSDTLRDTLAGARDGARDGDRDGRDGDG
jgi:hypothetical protein